MCWAVSAGTRHNYKLIFCVADGQHAPLHHRRSAELTLTAAENHLRQIFVDNDPRAYSMKTPGGNDFNAIYRLL